MESPETVSSYAISNSSTSPIVRRESDPFNFFNDSASAVSGSTFANSSVVEQQIKTYERNRDRSYKDNNQPAVFNVHINTVVIPDANNTQHNAGIDKTSMNDVLASMFDRMPRNVRVQSPTKFNKIKRYLRRPKIIVSLMVLVVVALSVSIPIILSGSKLDPPIDSTTSTDPPTDSSSDPPNDSTANESSTTSDPSTTISDSTSTIESTTTFKPPEDKDPNFYNRSSWEDPNFLLRGKYKQNKVTKVIVTETITDSCTNYESCLEFLKVQQQIEYPEYDDICENYYITLYGAVYEGRGLLRESQSTYESLTSYNNKAISVSFLLNHVDDSPEKNQTAALCWLLKELFNYGDTQLNENFKFYKQEVLTTSYHSNWRNKTYDDCNLLWETPPNMVKRIDWTKTDFPTDDFYLRRFSTKIIIASTGEEDCYTKTFNECATYISEYLAGLNGSHRYNFIVAGKSSENQSIIFEDKGFDVGSSEVFDGIWILVVGNFTLNDTKGKIDNLFENALEPFVQYAINLEKLSENYSILDEHQLIDVNRGDALYSHIESHSRFDSGFISTCDEKCI